MEKRIKLLAGLLGAQLLLALGLGLSGPELSARSEGAALIEVAMEEIDRITLEAPDQAKVVLAKKDGTWRLPDAGDFPADVSRVEQLLNKLIGLKTGAPVATTAGARERFRVRGDDFERRITLAHGDDTLATLYLGTSPGRGRIHARADGDDAIHAVTFAAYDAAVKTAEWEDKAVLQTPKAEIQAIKVAGLRLERSGQTANTGPDSKAGDKTRASGSPAWVAEALEEGKVLKPEAADKLAGLLANLRIGEVLGREAKPAYGLDKPLLEVTLARKDSSTVVYRLGKEAEKDDYILKASTRPEYFRVPAYTANPLIEAGKQEVLLGLAAVSGDGDPEKVSDAK